MDADEGPEVEISLSSGDYELVYWKRWLRRPGTTLEVKAPRQESLSGRQAHDRLEAILEETLDDELWRALQIDQGTELILPNFSLPSMGRALDRAAGGEFADEREESLWTRIGEEYGKYWTCKRTEEEHTDFVAEEGGWGAGEGYQSGKPALGHRKRCCRAGGGW